MKLIIGLGNPGIKFKNTRHNAGIWTIENWCKNQQFNDFSLKKKLEAKISENPQFVIAISQTFMNESGRMAKKTMKEFKITPKNLLLVHDDSDLMLGTFKLQYSRGSAGHNGVSSVVQTIASQEFSRLRIGIRPLISGHRPKAESFVLKRFNSSEIAKLISLLPKIDKSIKEWLLS